MPMLRRAPRWQLTVLDSRRSGLVAFIILGHRTCHGWAGFRDCQGGAPSIDTSITKCTAVRAAAPSGICFVRESSQHARAPAQSVPSMARRMARLLDSPGAWYKYELYGISRAGCHVLQHHIESRPPHASIVAPCMCSMSRPKQAQTKALASETPRAKQCG